MPAPSPVRHIARFFPTIEKISVAAFSFGFILKLTNNSNAVPIITIALTTLSVVYFLQSYLPLEVPSEPNSVKRPFNFKALFPRNIVPKLLGISSSVSVTGILFTILNWAGFRQMLLIGSTSLAIASLAALIASSNENMRKALQPRLARALPLLVIGCYLLWFYGLDEPKP